MGENTTLSSKARKMSSRRWLKRWALRIVALAALLAAAYYFLSPDVPFLMSIDGIVVDRKIQNVHVIGDDGPSKRERYIITVQQDDGELLDVTVPYEVFVAAKEGTPILKHPFSNRYRFE